MSATDPHGTAVTEPANLQEYEALAREVLPRDRYDFIAGGADDEITLRENVEAFRRLQLLPRMLVDVSDVDLASEVLGQRVEMPVLLAPVGSQGLAHPEGEVASARAAAAAGTAIVVGTTSSRSIEEVAGAADGPRWFQLYLFSQDLALRLIERAEAHGYGAVCVTVDSPRLGRRERDLRHRIQWPKEALPKNLIGETSITHRPYSWDEIDWLRSRTRMRLVLKGVLRADDARLAVEHGVDAVVVSNHGGRQLDGVPATIDVLPEIVEAVAGRCEVLLDGGVRRGTDVLKALALGAKAVLIGRPIAWGLAVDGEAGVRRVLDLLRSELELAMALAGCPSVAHVDSSLVRRRP